MAGTLSVDTIKSGSASTPPTFQDSAGTQVGTLCRAWVNFNGTGTVAIRASFNVTSITDNGTGDYTVNFTNAMPDNDFCAVMSGHRGNASGSVGNSELMGTAGNAENFTTTTVRIGTFNQSFAAEDYATVTLAIFR
jgi:hypothetical protein